MDRATADGRTLRGYYRLLTEDSIIYNKLLKNKKLYERSFTIKSFMNLSSSTSFSLFTSSGKNLKSL
jgi:hypothetical protein